MIRYQSTCKSTNFSFLEQNRALIFQGPKPFCLHFESPIWPNNELSRATPLPPKIKKIK